MSLLDKILGRHDQAPPPFPPASNREGARRTLNEDQAIERYRYLLRTAPPEAIEMVHREAFARLTPEQRSEVLRDLSARLPHYERAEFSSANADPSSLARVATRAELREPGLMERMLGRWGGAGGPSIGTSILGSFLAGFAGSLLANQLIEAFQGGGAEGFLADANGWQGGDDVEAEPVAIDQGESAEADFDGDFIDDADVDFDV